MIKTYKNGLHFELPEEWADKLDRYSQIEKIIAESSPYHDNRGTCNRIREIIKGGKRNEP